jgi:FkbH-like protein
MAQIVLQAEALKRLDAAALLSLLDGADSDALSQVWAPVLGELSSLNAAVVTHFLNQCEAQQLLPTLEAQGYLLPDSAWRGSLLGRWLTAKILQALSQSSAAWELYRQLLQEDSLPVALALDCVRAARAAGEVQLAYEALSHAMMGSVDFNEWQRAARLYQKLVKHAAFSGLPTIRVALLVTSAPQLLVPVLEAMGYAYGIRLELYVPDFNAIEQAIYDERSELHRFDPQVVILGANYRNLDFNSSIDDSEAWVTENTESVLQRWQALSSKFNCRILQQLFDLPVSNADGHLSASEPLGQTRLIQSLNLRLMEHVLPNVSIVDIAKVQAGLGGRQWEDARMWYVARQHPSPEAIPSLVFEYMAIIRAYAGKTKKVLVLDLDNTLWGGVIGEDGLDGIQIGSEAPEAEAYRGFQAYLLALKQRGVLLAVCSKNDADLAALPFREHDGMLISLEDIVAFKANWQPKHLNLQAMAKELSLGLDSFVFVDDNPAECHLVRRELPEVTVIELPKEPADYVTALHRGRWFETLSITAEDRIRSDTYKQAVERKHAEMAAPSLEDYLISLQMIASAGPFDSTRLQRIAQLTQRTNQFNLTTRRYSVEALEALSGDSSYWTRWFSLSDRFGGHGITGLIIAKVENDHWSIDTFLMSCRVIGRGFEDYMLNTLVAAAKQASAKRIDGLYRQTAKNQLVADFFTEHQFALSEARDEGGTYSVVPMAYQPIKTSIRAAEASL